MTHLKSYTWSSPPKDLDLSTNEVHVWNASLDLSSSNTAKLLRSLSSDEVDRADSFYFEPDRSRYIVRRGFLRILLSRYLEVLPENLGYTYSSYGKPSLEAQFAQSGLHFNVTHSSELALFAFSKEYEIGVDIECIRDDIEFDQIAHTLFSPSEQRSLNSLSTMDKIKGFYSCWTRKEAFIKARGQGLSIPLDQFDVSLAPEEKPCLLAVRNDLAKVDRWTILHLEPAPGYVGALALESTECSLRYWEFNELPDQ